MLDQLLDARGVSDPTRKRTIRRPVVVNPLRCYDEASYESLARRFDVSRSVIIEDEQRAFAKIRKAIEERAAAAGVSVEDWIGV